MLQKFINKLNKKYPHNISEGVFFYCYYNSKINYYCPNLNALSNICFEESIKVTLAS